MELLQSDVNVFSAIHVQSFLCCTIHFLQNVLENSNKPCSNVHKEFNLYANFYRKRLKTSATFKLVGT